MDKINKNINFNISFVLKPRGHGDKQVNNVLLL